MPTAQSKTLHDMHSWKQVVTEEVEGGVAQVVEGELVDGPSQALAGYHKHPFIMQLHKWYALYCNTECACVHMHLDYEIISHYGIG